MEERLPAERVWRYASQDLPGDLSADEQSSRRIRYGDGDFEDRALMPAQPNAPLSAQNKADLETTEKVARALLANPDAVYGADKKPQGVADDAWAKTKPTMVNFAQFTLGYVGATQKDSAKAQGELTKTLQADPTNAQASLLLAGVLLGQQKERPEQMPLALFEYARAATYDGPGALDANTRKTIDGFLAKAYATYHGSP